MPKARLVGVIVMAGAGVTPVPLKGMLCGLLGALSVTVTLPLRLPLAPGVNVTLIVHVPPGARAAVQVLVCAKSEALVPLTAMLLIVNEADPLFVTVTVCAVLVVPTF